MAIDALTSPNNPPASAGTTGFAAPLSPGQTGASAFQSTTPIFNPNANYNAGVTPIVPQPVSPTAQPISVSGLSTPQTPISLSPSPTPPNTGAVNASIPSPIPSISDIVTANDKTTPTQQTQSDLLGKIAQLTGSQSSLSTQEINSENTAGVPALSKTLSDLGIQLQGLSDQSTKLQNDATYTIPNTAQLGAAGRGITAGGLVPVTADMQRQNQIAQGQIATQALTVKSAYYAAQGNYNLAKDAADKAAQVAFDGTTQQINYQKALLDQIAPQLSKEQTAQATILKAQLDDRSQQIATQQDNFKTGQALAITAMQNNPQDQTAQFNAQQALKLDPTDPQYLQKVAALVGSYQTNEVQTQLDNQLKQAQIANTQANTAKTKQDIQLASNPNGTVPGTTGNPSIDVTSPGYSTQVVAGGLTQASIDQKALSYLTSGTLPPQGRTGASGIQNAAISNRMAEMAPGGNLAGNKAQLKSYSDSLGVQQKYLDSTQRAFNTANENLSALEQFMQQAGVNTSSTIPLVNSINNAIKAKAVDPGTISGFNAAIAGLRAEYAQVLSRGGEVTEGQRSQANSLIPDNLTPAQIQQVADRLNIEGTNAVGQAQSQVQKIQGQINDIISPPAAQTPTNEVIPSNLIPVGYYQASDGLFYKK